MHENFCLFVPIINLLLLCIGIYTISVVTLITVFLIVFVNCWEAKRLFIWKTSVS